MPDRLTGKRFSMRLRRIESRLDEISHLLSRIPDSSQSLEILRRSESLLNDLADSAVTREWYTVLQLAERWDKSTYTIADWCRTGRLLAERANSGHGPHKSWRIAHEEVRRYEREGLRPVNALIPQGGVA